MTEAAALDKAIDRVLRNDCCSGCGACTLLDPSLTMELNPDGFLRPTRTGLAPAAVPEAARSFERICPGRRVSSVPAEAAVAHPTMGPVIAAWSAWAADSTIRHRGSSGGALTALIAWLVDSGEVPRFAGAAVDRNRPDRTVAVTITSKDEALRAAGSRYAPVSSLDHRQPGSFDGMVAKPCEISAARSFCAQSGSETPLLLSFYCAGTPSQHATDELVTSLGIPSGTALKDLWYRGRGWPGHFTVTPTAGDPVSTTYDDSWGQHLGKATQWRCKICPDGVGGDSDITAADFWQTDDRGYPLFSEGEGCSALIARTPRGLDVLMRAFVAGVIIGERLDADQLARVQPLQVTRRTTLLGRIGGAAVAGRSSPRYGGFGLVSLALGNLRETWRTARGSFQRVRSRRHRHPSGGRMRRRVGP